MGEFNVFTVWFTRFIGVGISINIDRVTEQLGYGATIQPKVYKVLAVGISIPFVSLAIYFRKSKDNKWFVKQ